MVARHGFKPSLGKSDLSRYVARQCSRVFPDKRIAAEQLIPHVQTALQRAEYCFSRSTNKYFSDGNQTYFNHLHTDQYAMFLYLLGNTIYREGGDPRLAAKTYMLNKVLHSIDVFYEVELPDVFFFQHPIGTILGRAKYSNYFSIYQNCTVGANEEQLIPRGRGSYPTLGESVIMYGGSAIIGDCTVGDHCWLSNGTIVMNQDCPSNSIIFGRSPNIVIKEKPSDYIKALFRTEADR